MSWFGTPHFAMQILGARFRVQTHARHEPQASGAVSLLSAIATALSTAANRKNKFFIHFVLESPLERST